MKITNSIWYTLLILVSCQIIFAEYTNFYADPKNSQFIYVHLIPHTHDDVGWLKTPDEYYYGDRNDIQQAGVQYIISSVISALQKNPSYKFIYVEIAFFYKWWNEQSASMQATVKQLVKNGQLEFINGGWSMNDEGCTYYEDIIDQMTTGHQWLLNTFGVIPSIGWQIDPFGHSSSQAALFSQMGFNGFFVGRIDYYDNIQREKDKTLEMIWHPRQESQEDNYIFFRRIDSVYQYPDGFCFDIKCIEEPVMDDERLEGYNLAQKADQLATYLRTRSEQYYNTSIYMQTLGSDFQYEYASMWYINMDKLINYINTHQEAYNMQLLYSTPSQYLLHVNTQMYMNQKKFTKKLDDFLPITEVPKHGYQAGYFTSRVALKGLVYDTGRYIQLARTYLSLLKFGGMSNSLKRNEQLFLNALAAVQQAMGVLLHHDAITGTEKQAVANDYVYTLANAVGVFNNYFLSILREQSLTNVQELLSFSYCNWNVTTPNCQCVYNNIVNKNPVVVAIYNQGINHSNTLRIKVPGILVNIIDYKNNPINGEIVCANESLTYDCDLYFQANLKQFTVSYFKLIPVKNSTTTKKISGTTLQLWNFKKQFPINGGKKSVTLSYYNDKIKYQYNGNSQTFEVNYNQYHSFNGPHDNSGAYVFRPATPSVDGSISYNSFKKKTVYEGTIVSVIHMEGSHADTQLRFFNDGTDLDGVVEVQSYIYSLPDEGTGTEVVIQMKFNVDNDGIFYTDSNGLELMQRKLNYRPTFSMDLSEPAAGNFFPVNKMILINDTSNLVAVLNDRAQGGTSLKPGQVELMVHRRLFSDDGHGVGEELNELNENGIGGLEARLRHWIVFANNKDLVNLPRQVQFMKDQQPLQYYAQSDSTTFSKFAQQISVGIGQLPNYMKFYLQYIGNSNYIMRLHNLNIGAYNFTYSNSTFSSIVQYTLTGNQVYQNWLNTKMKWYEVNPSEEQTSQQSYDMDEATLAQIQVKQLQIKTYMVQSNMTSTDEIIYEDF